MNVDGRCYCGFIRYVADVDADDVEICHCTDCQVFSSSAFRVMVPARSEAFKLLSGELKIYVKTAESGRRRVQSFCPDCGTAIHSTDAEVPAQGRPSLVWLRAGAIVQRDQLIPKTQFWTRSRRPWLTEIATLQAVEKE
jgi:hypothetical protein